LKVKEFGKRKDNAEAQSSLRFAEKRQRDGNTEITEVGTQSSRRREEKKEALKIRRLCRDPSAPQRQKAPLLRSG